MRFDEHDLRAAAEAGLIDQTALERLTAFLAGRGSTVPTVPAAPVAVSLRYDLPHLLWYAGALIVIGAMGLFSTLAFAQMGGKALTFTALAYAAAFVAFGDRLWRKPDQRVPAGLMIAMAVAMAPLAVFGVQHELGWWSYGDPGAYRGFYIWIKGSWLPMEIATLLAGLIALWRYPYPFIMAVVAVALWFMSMDIAAWVVGEAEPSFEMRRSVSLWFGLAVLVLAWAVDQRRHASGDFGYWLHLFGMLAFWGAITAKSSDSEVAKALYCLMNVGLVLVSVFLLRPVYATFGAIGIALYLGHLADKVFRDSLLFPFALSAIGLAVIAAGLAYHRRREAIAVWIETRVPPGLRRWRPAHARGLA